MDQIEALASSPLLPLPIEAEGVTVTGSAIGQVGKLLDDEPPGTMLRVSVEGGGCSGFQYKYELTQDAADDDARLTSGKVTVLIDSVSLPFLAGCSIDYKVTLMGASFEIDNPNAVASCGCGTSFSI